MIKKAIQHPCLRHLCVCAMALWLGACAQEAPERPTVLATIKPLYLIAKDIAGDDIVVELLLDGTGDPHAYAMRVSDMQKVGSAQAYLLVGPTFEVFLAGAMANNQDKPKHYMLPDAQQASVTTGHRENRHQHANGSEHLHDQHVSSDHESRHPWLNLQRAAETAHEYAALFGRLLPEHAETFAQRAERFQKAAQLEYQKSMQRLLAFQSKVYLVNHNAYQDFSETFQLQAPLSLSDSTGQPLSAQRVKTLVEQAKGASCFIAESHAAANKKKAAMLGLPLVTIDPLGWVDSVDSYAGLIRYVTDQFALCFSEA